MTTDNLYLEHAEVVELTPILLSYVHIEEQRHFILIGNLYHRPGTFWSTPIEKFAPSSHRFYCAGEVKLKVSSYGFTAQLEQTFRRSPFMRAAGAKVVTRRFLLQYGGMTLTNSALTHPRQRRSQAQA